MLELIKMLCILLKYHFVRLLIKWLHICEGVNKSVLICLFKCLDQWKQAGGPADHFRKIKSALQQNFCNLSSKMLHKIVKLSVTDVRFPTSLEQHGSDAMVRKLLQQQIKNDIDKNPALVRLFWGLVYVCLHAAAHRPGLLCRLCGDRNGLRTERLRPDFHSWKRHRDW